MLSNTTMYGIGCMKKRIVYSLGILSICATIVCALGRKPSKVDIEGVKTGDIILHCASDKSVYPRYDTLIFMLTIKNESSKELVSEKIFSDYVEPSSAVSLIAVDEKGNRYSGFVGNRTDPGKDFDHYAIKIFPKKMLIFNFYHRDLRIPVFANDKPFAAISDRPGSYTVHAQIKKGLFNTKTPLISNKITITVSKK